jgi:hypothetical protein
MAKPVAPRFSRSFRRLCQVAALAGSDRQRRVIDGLLPIIMAWDDAKVYRNAIDLIDQAGELFGLPLEAHEVEGAFDRAVSSGNIIYNDQRGGYELPPLLRSSTLKQMEESEKLEISAQESWLAEVGSIVPDIPSDDLWNCLITYAGEMFLHHGYEATALLSDSIKLAEGDDEAEVSFTPGEALYKALQTAKIDVSNMSRIASAIGVFFNGANDERIRYVTELADSTFNLMALGIDEDTRNTLINHLPNLSIFIDTNVIFDIVGAQDSQLGAASIELLEVIRNQPISSFQLYCHPKTLQEVERTLDSIGSWLRRRSWPSSLSRALLNASPEISSIELKYHQTNAAVPTPPDVFLSRYSSMPTLLDQYGIKIYRDAVVETQEAFQERAELTAEYEAFIEKRANRKRPYEALDHDVTLWLAVRRRRARTGKGPLFSGALLLSADYMFRRFEREVMRPKSSSSAQIVTQPSSLLQALRPFVSVPSNYDAAFVQLFSTASFRVISPGLGQTVNSVASYLATYEGLPEEIATKILTNSILMSRLRDIDRNDIEFQRLVSDAVIDESKAIIRERDQLIEEQLKSAGNAKEVISELSAIADDLGNARSSDGAEGNDLADRLKRIEEKIAVGGLSSPVINVENAYGMQIGSGNTQHSTVNFESELPAIREFIERFREQLSDLPLSAEQLEDVSADLETAEAQLESKRPRPAILRAAVESLREVAINAAGSAAGSGIFVGLTELAQHIHL